MFLVRHSLTVELKRHAELKEITNFSFLPHQLTYTVRKTQIPTETCLPHKIFSTSLRSSASKKMTCASLLPHKTSLVQKTQ